MISSPSVSAAEQVFAEHFAEYGNAAAAAQAAGHPADRAAAIADALLRTPHVQKALHELAEAEGVSAAEAMLRLSHWARGSVAPFLHVGPDGQLRVDLSTEQAQQHLHLLHRVREVRYITQTKQGPVEVVETEIELYDALQATHRVLQLHDAYPPLRYDLTSNGQQLPSPVTIHSPAGSVAAASSDQPHGLEENASPSA